MSEEQMLEAVAVLIPAFRPSEALAELVKDLVAAGFGSVLVVDDGSGAESDEIFERLTNERVWVLRLDVNRGKGAALKAGFAFLLQQSPMEWAWVVTADADGQHEVGDVVRVAGAAVRAGGQAMLGCRNLDGEVPFRSRLGNGVTRGIFRMVTGVPVRDTQTGLRGFPRPMLPGLLGVRGARYEYEMAVLAWLCRRGAPVEVPIRTIYLDANASSHFKPVRDSARVLAVLAGVWWNRCWQRK